MLLFLFLYIIWYCFYGCWELLVGKINGVGDKWNLIVYFLWIILSCLLRVKIYFFSEDIGMVYGIIGDVERKIDGNILSKVFWLWIGYGRYS